jgi:hypothetical protein
MRPSSIVSSLCLAFWLVTTFLAEEVGSQYVTDPRGAHVPVFAPPERDGKDVPLP